MTNVYTTLILCVFFCFFSYTGTIYYHLLMYFWITDFMELKLAGPGDVLGKLEDQGGSFSDGQA